MTKTITKIVTTEVSDCTQCPFMSPCHTDPNKWDTCEIALICSHPEVWRVTGWAWSDRRVDQSKEIPEFCPLDTKE